MGTKKITNCKVCGCLFNDENKKGGYCRDCYNQDMKLVMRKKNENVSDEEIEARRLYHRQRNKILGERKKSLECDELIKFVEYIIDNQYWVSLEDINNIITHYYSLGVSLDCKYGNKSAGRQIQLMFKDLVEYRNMIKEKERIRLMNY